MELLNENDKAYSIGQLYFTPERDKNDKPISKYEGVIAGFIVRRDDNSEFEVRSTVPLPFAKRSLTHSDLEFLRVGDVVADVISGHKYTVLKVFPTYGDIWLKSLDDGKTTAKKYKDLRRV